MNDRIYLGIKSKVVCLDKRTGREIWRRDIKRCNLVNVVIDGETVLVYAGGHLVCLDGQTGEELWRNTLPGLGYGYGIIATAGSQTAIAAAQQTQAQQAAAVAASSAAVAASSASSSG